MVWLVNQPYSKVYAKQKVMTLLESKTYNKPPIDYKPRKIADVLEDSWIQEWGG